MLNIESFRNYCLSKPGVTECLPFDESTLVFKVGGKMFALTDLEDPFTITLKAQPEEAIAQREKYQEIVIPGYHMNKKHWNTVVLHKYPALPESNLYQWTDDSYNLVFKKLPKRIQQQIKEQTPSD
jgi:predicted DNA-binding protein (MmcQ/YjbR family)